MFWGLVLEPSKRYTQKVQQSFHISQASIELSTCDSEPIQLILEYDGANYVLATLSKKLNIYQVPLDLNFNAGDQISFRTIGRGRVHLTGYHILEDDLENMFNGEESDVEDEVEEEEEEETDNSILEKQTKRKKPDSSKSPSKKKKLDLANEAEGSDDESDEEDTFGGDDSDLSDSEDDEVMKWDEEDEENDLDDDEEDDEDEEDEEEVVVKKGAPSSAQKNNKANASMNGKAPKNKKMPDSTKGTPKSAKKSPGTPGKEMKENKTPKSEKKSPKSEKKGNQDHNKSKESSPQKKVLEGGVIIEELRMGEGQIAKPGKMAQVYYVGRLQSTKKQFDATTQGPGFKFRLGRGEVIKGWDIGVNGMKVGGKRRITIPAQLAYGTRGSPPAIPPNSTLVFEVELKNLN